MEYTLDASAAKQADQLFSKIEQKGRYLGTITRAEQVVSKKDSKGIDLSFKTETGATADYLSIWTHNREGKQLQGFNLLMAIMTCLRVKGLKAELGEVEKYDSDTKQRVKAQVLLFKELMNKPVGLLIHMEEYEKKFREAFPFFIYCPENDLSKLFDWFRENPVPPFDFIVTTYPIKVQKTSVLDDCHDD